MESRRSTPFARGSNRYFNMMLVLVKGEKRLAACGHNSHDCCGFKQKTAVPTLSETPFDCGSVVEIACGWEHSLVLLRDGTVWTSGHAYIDFGGENAIWNKILFPSSVWIVQVAAGYEFSVFRTNTNDLYVLGGNDHGQLGLGHEITQNMPVKVLSDVIDVECGAHFTLAWLADGRILGCGNNEFHQFSWEEKKDISVFVEADAVSSVDLAPGGVMCGYEFTVGLDREGRVWSLGGTNALMQRGLKSGQESENPTEIPLPERIVQLSVGYDHTLARSVSGRLYGWGCNTYAQLHASESRAYLPLEIPVPKGEHVRKVVAYNYASLVWCASGALYAVGCGDSGMLGVNENGKVEEWTKVCLGNMILPQTFHGDERVPCLLYLAAHAVCLHQQCTSRLPPVLRKLMLVEFGWKKE